VTVATVAAYVDGFNLYYGIRSKYGHKYLWLDVVELIRQLRPADQVVSVRYFSAIVKSEPAAAQNQADYIAALKAHNGPLLDVRLGRFKDRRIGPCRICQQDYTCACPRIYRSYEEKETDVALGAMMVADAARGIGDVSVLVSADTDMVPAVEATRMVAPKRDIYLAMPPGKSQPSRRFSAGVSIGWFKIGEQALKQAQLPFSVTDSLNVKLTRPAKWS
jgi:uncharacterized LabA/DUF88 family protein